MHNNCLFKNTLWEDKEGRKQLDCPSSSGLTLVCADQHTNCWSNQKGLLKWPGQRLFLRKAVVLHCFWVITSPARLTLCLPVPRVAVSYMASRIERLDLKILCLKWKEEKVENLFFHRCMITKNDSEQVFLLGSVPFYDFKLLILYSHCLDNPKPTYESHSCCWRWWGTLYWIWPQCAQ